MLLQQVSTYITKSVRADKRQHTTKMVEKDVDERDQYIELTCLRRPFQAVPLGMRDKDGTHIPFTQRANQAAYFSGHIYWDRWRRGRTK